MKRRVLALLMMVCLLAAAAALGEGTDSADTGTAAATEAPAQENATEEGQAATETTPENETEAEGTPAEEEIAETGMPSIGDALHCYPDDEVTHEDGSVTEVYHNVTEERYKAIKDYLGKIKATLKSTEEETAEETPAEQNAAEGTETEDGQTAAEETVPEEKTIEEYYIQAENTEETLFLRYNKETLDAEVTYPKGTFDTRIRTAQTQNEAAQHLSASGNQYQAVVEYLKIPDYALFTPAVEFRNSSEVFNTALTRIEDYQTPGNIIALGEYEQDNDAGNGPEKIEWVVLTAVDAEKSLLISRRALEVMQFNPEFDKTTWLTSAIRTWLNGDFAGSAFSKAELETVLTTDVDNSKDQGYDGYDTSKVKNSEDQFFLLSYKEVSEYIPNDADRICEPTEYAVAKGAVLITTGRPGVRGCWWWLRSPGYSQLHAAYIGGSGYVYAYGVNFQGIAVRPAFWISLEKVVENGL